jgi:hypothetical protein
VPESASSSPIYGLYKANGPFEDQQCFADYLNQTLRNGIELSGPWVQAAEELDGLIAAAALDQPTLLHRATIDAYVAPFITGSELIYPAYMSTTTDVERLPRHFANSSRGLVAALMNIECETGARALDMELRSSFGGFERELLLPRRARFQITSEKLVSDRREMERIMSVVYAANYSALKVYDLRYLGTA